MIFTIWVLDKDNQQFEEPLAFVRYYAVKPPGKKTKGSECGIWCGRLHPAVVSSAADSQTIEL